MPGAKNRTAAKIDINQPAIVKVMRDLGMGVEVLKVPSDLLVAKFLINVIVEVKNPEMDPSKRRLTSDERDFWDRWEFKGLYCVIETVDDVVALNKAFAKGFKATAIYCNENMQAHFETCYKTRK
ncbi:hypothetical protein KAR91_54375 [Candidatus Pacearchaeota archaeon]|nr:hypothetical protein [Candidatus Pacearchaeota archaeon]